MPGAMAGTPEVVGERGAKRVRGLGGSSSFRSQALPDHHRPGAPPCPEFTPRINSREPSQEATDLAWQPAAEPTAAAGTCRTSTRIRELPRLLWKHVGPVCLASTAVRG